MLDKEKVRAALLIGLKPKPGAEGEGDQEEGPGEEETELRDHLGKMFDAIVKRDRQEFVECGVAAFLEEEKKDEEQDSKEEEDY